MLLLKDQGVSTAKNDNASRERNDAGGAEWRVCVVLYDEGLWVRGWKQSRVSEVAAGGSVQGEWEGRCDSVSTSLLIAEAGTKSRSSVFSWKDQTYAYAEQMPARDNVLFRRMRHESLPTASRW